MSPLTARSSFRVPGRTASILTAVVLLGVAAAALPVRPAFADDAPAPELRRGKLLFIQCRACHELKEGEPDKVGPNLHGLIGRKSASAEGFNYSAALKAINITWDRATLDKWIEKPSAVAPGTAMAFAGIASPQDRAALIAYLEAETR